MLRPVVAKLCLFESLKDGTIDLADVALMHDVLDVEAANQAKVQRYLETKKT